jgi:hypothetical protein
MFGCMPDTTRSDVALESVTAARPGKSKGRKWSHITVHATPDFHHEYKLFALTHGLTMQQLMKESFELFKAHLEGQGRRRAE